MGYSPQGHKESDMTEHTAQHVYIYIDLHICILLCLKILWKLLKSSVDMFTNLKV